MDCAKNQEKDLVNKMLSMDLGLMLNNGTNTDLNFREQNGRTSSDQKRNKKVEMVSHWLEQSKQSPEDQLGLEGLRRLDKNGASGWLEGLQRMDANETEGLGQQGTLEGLGRMQQSGGMEDQLRFEGLSQTQHLSTENWISGCFPSSLPTNCTSFPSRTPSTTFHASFSLPNSIATQQMVNSEGLPYQSQSPLIQLQNQPPPMSASLPEQCGFNVYVHKNQDQFNGSPLSVNPLNRMNQEGHLMHGESLPIPEEGNPVMNPMYNPRLSSRNYTPGMDATYNWTTLGSDFDHRNEACPSLGSGFQPFSTPMGTNPPFFEDQRPRSNSLGGTMRPALVGQPGGPRGNPRRYNGQRGGAGKRFCNFCKTNGEIAAVFQSHSTGPPGDVTCPNLFKHKCEVCGATGRNAHTRAYCPLRQNNDRPLVLALKNTLRKSDGRLRKESW